MWEPGPASPVSSPPLPPLPYNSHLNSLCILLFSPLKINSGLSLASSSRFAVFPLARNYLQVQGQNLQHHVALRREWVCRSGCEWWHKEAGGEKNGGLKDEKRKEWRFGIQVFFLQCQELKYFSKKHVLFTSQPYFNVLWISAPLFQGRKRKFDIAQASSI